MIGRLIRPAEAWRSLPGSQRILLAALAALLLLVQVDQPFPETALLHHMPTAGLLLVSPWLLGRWPLSTASLACIILFFALHTIGGRYSYVAVPYDEVIRAVTGTSLGETFGWSRNHWDRLVHLAYGLLAVAPLRELLGRHLGVTPRLALYFAVESVFAVSALYEIIEWLFALLVAGPTAAAYNGQQGDIWDAQKDMALAGLGALFMLAAGIWRAGWRKR